MTPSELLQAEVTLLLLRHGRSAVLRALASRMAVPIEELEREVSTLQQAKFLRPRRVESKPFDIDALVRSHPLKAEQLVCLHSRFLNRTFLPELKDVKRFFERHGRPIGNLKSRAIVTRHLFEFLAELPAPLLERLSSEEPASAGVSSLGVISDEILRHSRGSEKK